MPHAWLAAENAWMIPQRPGRKRLPPARNRCCWLGSGGLTCAYYLALKGHSVKVFEMMPQAGGMTRYGIPEYRLQKDMLDKEFAGVWNLGVELQTNIKLGQDFTLDDLFTAGYDAVFLGIGAWTSNPVTFVDGSEASPEDTEGLINAISYLMDKTVGWKFRSIPIRSDCAWWRFYDLRLHAHFAALGAKTHTVYRRGRKEMTATAEEVDDGEAEARSTIAGRADPPATNGWQAVRHGVH